MSDEPRRAGRGHDSFILQKIEKLSHGIRAKIAIDVGVQHPTTKKVLILFSYYFSYFSISILFLKIFYILLPGSCPCIISRRLHEQEASYDRLYKAR
jgi:hypothetical protein